MTLIDSLLRKWQIQCIIFDLDGTLVDTLDLHIEAFERLFREQKISIVKKEIEENMGRTPKDTLESLIPELSKNKAELVELANRKEEILSKLLIDIPVYPGVRELLIHFKKMPVKICLASSTPKFNVMKIISNSNLQNFFDVIITGEDISIGKPNPDVFLKAASKANIQIDNCLVIGDSPHDIQAAKNANMKIIAVNTGKHSFSRLEQEKPNILIKSLLELMK